MPIISGERLQDIIFATYDFSSGNWPPQKTLRLDAITM